MARLPGLMKEGARRIEEILSELRGKFPRTMKGASDG
jgi:hypothetical protein